MKPPVRYSIVSFAAATAFFASVGLSWGNERDCLSCHGDTQKVGPSHHLDPLQYRNTAHASLATANFGCRTCHDAVSVGHPNDGITPPKTTACTTCHKEAMDEYNSSGHARNATCTDCHDPHSAFAPSEISGAEMNKMCHKCHTEGMMVQKHSAWLPQANLHMDSVPCITCHTGSENYVITMYIVKRQDDPVRGNFTTARYDELRKIATGKDIIGLVDANNDCYISLSELRLFNRNPEHSNLRLHGMMTPETVTHTFQVLDNRWDCSFCHASGPSAMQTSYLALPTPDGTFMRTPVEKGAVLDAMYGTPDFYMLGSTRSPLLDKVGFLIIMGGLIMPIGHGTLRFLTRKNRTGKGASHE